MTSPVCVYIGFYRTCHSTPYVWIHYTYRFGRRAPTTTSTCTQATALALPTTTTNTPMPASLFTHHHSLTTPGFTYTPHAFTHWLLPRARRFFVFRAWTARERDDASDMSAHTCAPHGGCRWTFATFCLPHPTRPSLPPALPLSPPCSFSPLTTVIPIGACPHGSGGSCVRFGFAMCVTCWD